MKFKILILRLVAIFLLILAAAFEMGLLDFRSDIEKAKEAINEKNSRLCEKVWDQDIKYACKGIIEKDPDICEKIGKNTDLRDACFGELSRVWIKQGPAMCEKINKNTVITATNTNVRDACFRNVAWGRNDSNLCEKINDAKWKDSCYSFMFLMCEKVSNQTEYDDCVRRRTS